MGCSLISRLIIGLLKVWLNSEEFYLVLLIFFRGAKCVLGWDWARWRSSRRSDADGGEAGTVDAAPTAGYGRATSADWTNAELCDVQSPSVSIGCQCETTFMTVHSVHRNPRATVSLQLLFFLSMIECFTGEGGAGELLGVEAVRTFLWRILADRQRVGATLVLGGELVAETAQILRATSKNPHSILTESPSDFTVCFFFTFRSVGHDMTTALFDRWRIIFQTCFELVNREF